MKAYSTLLRTTVLLLFLAIAAQALTQPLRTQNLVLITIDGLRWQEVYSGAVDSLMTNRSFVSDTAALRLRYDAPTASERRKILMPFFWNTIAKEGQLYGNRWKGNKMNVANRFWFSYPGYNEILCGDSDPKIRTNDTVYNENITVLEWFNNRPEFNGKVAVFASWNRFPYIVNEPRSGIPVNAGFQYATGDSISPKEQVLNELQDQIPSPWATVRLDAFTHHYAMEYLKRKQVRVLYIAYGETDDFGHDGKYDEYLHAANRTSQWISELWEYLQSQSFYRGNTTMVITTDHGRGTNPFHSWRRHGRSVKGSDETWLAVLGPDTPPRGEMDEPMQLWNRQIAQSCAAFFKLTYRNGKETGAAIPLLITK